MFWNKNRERPSIGLAVNKQLQPVMHGQERLQGALTTTLIVTIFRVYGTLRLSCAQPTGNSFTPNQRYRWKATL